ncbi:MAG: stage V sporulation protein AC [Clostridia bacterium]|nr:stage V sporulation protein AC [Clostridia bacterium]
MSKQQQNSPQSKAAQEYQKLVERLSPKSDLGKGLLRAFWVGGVICICGQLIYDGVMALWSLDKVAATTVTSVILVFLGAFLTGIGVYDRLGKYAGGGSIVPITGFANSIVASAMEFKREGFVTGVGAKMFTIAGPVLVYGIGASVIVGVIYFIIGG